MSVKSITFFSDILILVWADGSESVIKYADLRNACPCAFCSGEKDVLGNIYKGPKQNLGDISYKAIKMEKVGHYAIRIFWGDNHADGLYTYELLRKLGEISEN